MPIFSKIVGLFGSDVAIVNFVPFGLFAKDVGVGCSELGLVKGIAETLAALGNFLLDFFLNLTQVILDEDIGTISFLGVFVVDEGVVEGANVARGLPNAGMHEYGGVDTHDILIQAGHRFPPIILDVVLELHAHLPVVINGCKTVINLAGGEYETILLAMGYKHLEKFFLCHIYLFCHFELLPSVISSEVEKSYKFTQIFPEMLP